jgi:NAD(P)H-hydrate epimerase
MMTDSGKAAGVVVDADYTVALGSVKRGHVLYPGSSYTGTLLYSPIGIPNEARMDFPVRLTEREDVFNILPVRNRVSHKGKNGFIGIFAGSDGMEGAALLAGQGALYAGGGKVAVVTAAGAAHALAGRIPELMVSSIGKGPFFTGEDSGEALEKAKAYDVVALGPGLGRNRETGRFVKDLVTSFDGTMVIDADGLFALKEENISLDTCPGRLILTPHVGEFSHLTGLTPKEIEDGRIDEAIRFAVENHVVLVLKGAPTVTAMPDGSAYVNPTGNPGMATGGMGDTLTGIIAALAGQGMNASGAALAGVYLHGLAGDMAAEKTPVGYGASDLAKLIPAARAEVMKMGR